MPKILIALFTTFVLSGCFHRSGDHLCEVYSGMLPAASSVGIETTISFLPNGRFTQKDVYVGEKDGIFFSDGYYTLDKKRITLTSSRGDISLYRLEKGQIRRLDADGQEVSGALADFYILECR